MALVTYVLVSLVHSDGTELRLEIDFDDTDAVADPDEQYGSLDPTSGDLVRFRVVNTSTVTGRVLVARQTGPKTKFWDIPCPPGDTESPPSGGPIKSLDDVTFQISSQVP